ncbi:alkaline phosphatase PafA [Terrimonas rubra]|uniref:Alkaline phosphatase PafA n=1 Tax=Terrimonas rubra TaxID=1035890 RepID=A0ABW6A635_9BACT
MKFIALSLLALFSYTHISAQAPVAKGVSRPKLVVGIMIDQMRWDYLYRFNDRFTNDGFKRLLQQGHTCENTFIPYTPTYTAVGHTSVYTGSVPAITGIVGNNWYRKDLKKTWYCTDDSTVVGVGSNSSAGKMSPANLWTTTITDELRLATNFKSKTIGIAIKDRGGILPAGHTANAAYWFDNKTGGWITSSYYMNALPEWVINFNKKELPAKYLAQNWNTLFDIKTYTQSTADEKPYEGKINGEDNTFPHITNNLKDADKWEAFKKTPYGNTYTFDMAKAAIEGEKLGQTGNTDFLAVSFSSTDYTGHTFGPNSIEVEDTYLRYDRDLADFLKYLDAKIGKGQYTLFLTADHAVAHVPGFMTENRIPAGVFDDEDVRKWVNEKAEAKFAVKNAIEKVINYQLFVDYTSLESGKVNEEEFKKWVVSLLKQHPAIMTAFDLNNLAGTPIPAKIKERVTNGYNAKLSGDIQFVFMPQYFDGGKTGTTHGAWNPYDAHIPLLWYGFNIKPGKTNRETYMTDIAPTVAALLQIQMPNGCIGDVIPEVLK